MFCGLLQCDAGLVQLKWVLQWMLIYMLRAHQCYASTHGQQTAYPPPQFVRQSAACFLRVVVPVMSFKFLSGSVLW